MLGDMKSIWLVATLAVVLAAAGISSAQLPDLVGNWTGRAAGYIEGEYWESSNTSAIVMMIEEQKDRLLTGRFVFRLAEGEQRMESFSGSVALDNRTLYIAEYDRGYDVGTMISPDEMELIYLEDGANLTAVIDHLYRKREEIGQSNVFLDFNI
jgi:hypothetical protein